VVSYSKKRNTFSIILKNSKKTREKFVFLFFFRIIPQAGADIYETNVLRKVRTPRGTYKS